jgi:[acyl-carrier-protein] S-malonyltransferase
LATLEHALPAHGARRCVRLAVRTPSHTPLLASAQAPLAEALAPWASGRLAVPVVSGIDGRAHRDAGEAVHALAAQVARPVAWSTCMDTLLEYAPDAALEIGPGNALARMLGERAPDLAVRSIDDFSSDDAVLEWLGRMAA